MSNSRTNQTGVRSNLIAYLRNVFSNNEENSSNNNSVNNSQNANSNNSSNREEGTGTDPVLNREILQIVWTRMQSLNATQRSHLFNTLDNSSTSRDRSNELEQENTNRRNYIH